MIESLLKQADEELFAKRVTGGLFDYYSTVYKEKKWEYLVHSKSKVIISLQKIILLNEIFNDQDISKLTGD